MTDIFISYAREDRERARMVAKALQARGWSVWWDRDVKAGQAFDQIIERELETAKSVVVLWSKDSIASDWVKGEAAAAVLRGVLVPALIDNVKLPLEFSRRQTADLIGWEGDISHAGFQALCDAMAGPPSMTPGAAAPNISGNRQAERESWKQTWVLKGRWQTLPGILVASGLFLAGLAALVVALNQVRTPKVALTQTGQPGETTPTSGTVAAQPGRPTNTAPTVAPSTDRDTPTWLTSNEIRGLGVGEDISYYYAFNAGPGTVRVTVDGKNRRGGLANALGIELSDIDARRLLRIHVGYTTLGNREVEQVQIGRQQQVIMRVLLDQATLDYMVRVEGAVDFRQASTPPK
jgi:hypothetical protein